MRHCCLMMVSPSAGTLPARAAVPRLVLSRTGTSTDGTSNTYTRQKSCISYGCRTAPGTMSTRCSLSVSPPLSRWGRCLKWCSCDRLAPRHGQCRFATHKAVGHERSNLLRHAGLHAVQGHVLLDGTLCKGACHLGLVLVWSLDVCMVASNGDLVHADGGVPDRPGFVELKHCVREVEAWRRRKHVPRGCRSMGSRAIHKQWVGVAVVVGVAEVPCRNGAAWAWSRDTETVPF